jgi:hypothetical protein
MNCGIRYQLFDEQSELMRIVLRKEEALAVVALRSGWTYKRIVTKSKNEFKFEEALF